MCVCVCVCVKYFKTRTYCNGKNFDDPIYCIAGTSLSGNKFNLSIYIFGMAGKVSTISESKYSISKRYKTGFMS